MAQHPGVNLVYRTEDGAIWETLEEAEKYNVGLQKSLQVARAATEFMDMWGNVEITKLSQVLPTVEDLLIEWLNTTKKVKVC
jgi:hypothetical protein